jgi:hypothetical protein
MEEMPRHQCLIYDGSPAKMLPALAAHIKQKLSENVRCLYLNSPTMVAGMRSYLFAGGVDVVYEVARTSLILTSDRSHVKDGHFDIDQMLRMLEETLNTALSDGYRGLFATGDMTWELGQDKDLKELLEYEWRLEKFFQRNPAISGICQYHADTLPRENMYHGLLVHPALYINQTLTVINPHYLPSEAHIQPAIPTPELHDTIHNLCAMQMGGDMNP